MLISVNSCKSEFLKFLHLFKHLNFVLFALQFAIFMFMSISMLSMHGCETLQVFVCL